VWVGLSTTLWLRGVWGRHWSYAAQFVDGVPLSLQVPARRHPGINFVFAHFGGGATYLETITLCERVGNCFADCCRGRGQWVWEHRMPGLEDFPTDKFLYGTDNMGERYLDDETLWTELVTDMDQAPEELEMFFDGNAARMLGIATG